MAVKPVVLLCFVLASLLLAIQSVTYARELTEADGLRSLSISLSLSLSLYLSLSHGLRSS